MCIRDSPNIAHGCNSVIATNLAMRLSDYVVTEAGFGADLGAEKFLDIKCRSVKHPDAVVLVATLKALKYHGGVKQDKCQEENIEALEKGIENLKRHVENIEYKYGIKPIVAINKYENDSAKEIEFLKEKLKEIGVNLSLVEVWAKGGEGGIELAEEVLRLCEQPNDFQFCYEDDLTLAQKIEAVSTKIYGADGVIFTPKAKKELERLESLGFGNMPVCMAKTQYSLSDNPALLGRPENFDITVKEVRVSNGAGFIVVLTGDIMTMPGLPKVPAANRMDILENGEIVGLF